VIAVVNPAGATLTSCRIEYGTTTSYGNSVPMTECSGDLLRGQRQRHLGALPQPEHRRLDQ
jgi:hypothetical protein